MSDKSIPNSWNTYSRYGKDTSAKNKESSLRAYTYSPDCIAIQIRTPKGFATAILSDAQARLFASMIIEAIQDH